MPPARCATARRFSLPASPEQGRPRSRGWLLPTLRCLTDEISYLRRNGHGYVAHGTPFAGELAKVGENVQAPLAALFLLHQAPENKIQPVSEGDAVRALMESILFFAHDSELVNKVFESACDLVRRVPVFRLSFVPDHRVWELIV